MPYQQGPILLNGTISNVTFYKRDGKWIARKKTSLSKERVITDPAFRLSRKAAKNFGQASILAKEVYWQLPGHKRAQGVFGKLTGAANDLMRKHYTLVQVKQLLYDMFA